MKKLCSLFLVLALTVGLMAASNFSTITGARMLYNYFLDFVSNSDLGTTNHTIATGQKKYQDKFIDFLVWADSIDAGLNPLSVENICMSQIGDSIYVVSPDTNWFHYNTITEALDSVSAGMTIFVLPGTYAEHIDVDVSNLNIIALAGPENTIIDVTMSSNAGIDVTVDSVLISGFTVKGSAAGSLILISGAPSNVVIENCVINTTGSPTFGLNISTDGSDGTKFLNNKFISNSADGCFYGNKSITNLEIIGNEFIGADSASGYAIQIAGVQTMIVRDNWIHASATVSTGGFASGIFPHTVSGTASDSIKIENNVIRDCSKAIRLGHSSNAANLTTVWVTGNTVYNNTTGLYIAAGTKNLVNTFLASDNQFYDNFRDITNDNVSYTFVSQMNDYETYSQTNNLTVSAIATIDTAKINVLNQNLDADQRIISDLGTLKTDSVTSNSGNLKLSGTGTGIVEIQDTLDVDDISNSAAIEIRASGDNDNYIDVSTTTDLPQIRGVGGTDKTSAFKLTTDDGNLLLSPADSITTDKPIVVGISLVPDVDEGAFLGTAALQFSDVNGADGDFDSTWVGALAENVDGNQKNITDLNKISTDTLLFGIYDYLYYVVEGNSLSDDSEDWPNYLDDTSSYFAKGSLINYALSGATVANMVTDYATQGHVSAPTANNDEAYFMVMGGINDINAGVNAPTIFNNLKTLWAEARVDGYKVVAFTLLPAQMISSPENVQRLALNDSILYNQSLYDYLVRPDLALPDTANATYYSDGTHLTIAGSKVIANLVVESILTNKVLNGTLLANQNYIYDLGTLKVDSVMSNSGNLQLSGTGTGDVVIIDSLNIGTSTTQNSLNLSSVGYYNTAPGIDFFGTINTGAYAIYNSGRIYSKFASTGYNTARITISTPTAENVFTDVLTVNNGNIGVCDSLPPFLISGMGATPIFNLTDSDVNILTNTTNQASDSVSVVISAESAAPYIKIGGATHSVDQSISSISLRGDADNDISETTAEVINLTLTANSNPTLSTWAWTSTQSAGYSFDKALTLGGNLSLGANSISMTGAIGATGSRVSKLWATAVEVTSAAGLTINGSQINSDALSDVASIAMLDENEEVTGAWVSSNAAGLTVGKNGGNSGKIGFVASDNDLADITINTSDQIVFTGAAGGVVAATGTPILVGTTQWDASATDSINGAVIAAGTIPSLSLVLAKDLVAGDGLGGGENDVFPGAEADVTVAVLLDVTGGLETVDDSINIKLDGATLALSSTGLKVADNTYQPLEATLTDIADGTIAENLVNTANPWADDEVADNITASSYTLLTAFDDSVAAYDGDGISVVSGDIKVNLDVTGGLETADDSINVKLDGATLALSSAGLKVADNTYQAVDDDLTDLADGSLTASKVAGVADADYGDVVVSSGAWSVTGMVRMSEVWVTSASQNPSLVTLPANAKVLSVECWVSEAFTSDAADEVTVGYDGSATEYATAIDVSSTGVKSVTLGATAKTVDATSRAVEVYYVNGGTEPGAGKAHVSITWIQSTVSP